MPGLPRPGDELEGRYRVEEEIGAGGMATVYRALDLRHNRRVALKVLKPELADVLGKGRFLREIEVTANLQHPNILPLYDSGETGSMLFYVMPYVEGESLRDALERRGQLPIDEALGIARSVASALQYAHDRGVVHRDLKPENVMLHEGQALVADFGIALSLSEDERDRLTSTGVSVGTPGYMSPEQASGEPSGPPSDVFSLGILTYEMLTGSPPFVGDTPRAVLTDVLTGAPPSLEDVRPEVPAAVSAVVASALEKDPERRPGSAGRFGDALRPEASGVGETGSPRARRRPLLVAAAVAAVAAIAITGFVLWRDARGARWVHQDAIPEIERLLAESENARAFRLVGRASRVAPNDPTIATLLEMASVEAMVTSEPSDARVSYRPYAAGDSVWTDLGRTPITGVRVPAQQLILRFERDGYRPLEIAFHQYLPEAHVELVPAAQEDEVSVPAGVYTETHDPVELGPFRLDRTEVTHADFQRFVDAGGYEDARWWTAPFDRHAAAPDPAEVRERLVDATGRPGPAGWELSRYPEGTDDEPVQGISWFEAVAYCAWAGKDLPTYYHWRQGSGARMDAWGNSVRFSNLAGEEPLPVGATGAVGSFGTVDMSGNVREWVWNAAGTARYILGGSWRSTAYMSADPDTADPWSRDPTNGFRCATYPEPPDDALLAPVERPVYDFRGVDPVDDETFATFASFYAYDRGPLRATRTVVDSTDDWIRERVEYDAAYPGERVVAHIFLPRGVEPPYQTVVYFPGAAGRYIPSSENVSEMVRLMFLPLSGRALVYPVLKGMYERQYEGRDAGPAARRQWTIWVTQDIMRTVDYVEEREDLDDEALAYMGLSLGGELATPPALEKRFDALVLIGAALDPAWRGIAPPAAAPLNFVYRITTPTLLVNGRWDFMHPYEEGQVPFFEAIDVPEEDKEFVVLETGHVPPWNDIVRETLGWLEDRLGRPAAGERVDRDSR